MRTDPRMTADELDVAVRALLGQYAPQVSAIAALSTVPSLLRELRLLLDRRTRPAQRGRRPGRAHRRPAAGRQPARGRRGPGGEHPRRAPAVRHGLHRRRLRHVDQHRRRLRARRVPRRRARPGHRDLDGSACGPRGRAAHGRAGAAALGDRQEHGGVPAVGRALRLRRAGRRAGAADPRGARRRSGDGAGHRRARPAHGGGVGDDHHLRTGSHPARAAADLPAQPPEVPDPTCRHGAPRSPH